MKALVNSYNLKDYPGFVEFYIIDIYDQKHVIVDKLPVLGIDFINDISKLPKQIDIPFEVIELYKGATGKSIQRIKLLYNMETINGKNIFEIYISEK